jgi:hypothetical protein
MNAPHLKKLPAPALRVAMPRAVDSPAFLSRSMPRRRETKNCSHASTNPIA